MDRSTRRLFLFGLATAVLVAVGVSQLGSADPDGLEFVAESEGFANTATDGPSTPLAGYGEDLDGNRGLNRALSGLAGVLVTLAIGYGVFLLARRAGHRNSTPSGHSEP